MGALSIVIDSNVLVSALRSKLGASFRLIHMIDDRRLLVNNSVPLFLEYEDAAKRLVRRGGLRSKDVDAILDYVAAIGQVRTIHYLWRPLLRDPKDDMVLEVAVASGADAIVTFKSRDFDGAEQFGLQLLTPRQVLQTLGEIQ